ncbi:alpha-amylase family glycosyl hydrolase [Jannaschia sp. R86511]|uniref:alpha-amylase family glycosyl hydrolase n=1 Tax=Jannaschia sp. R86511 TaxID=3093853 RepID=UPI0036D27403
MTHPAATPARTSWLDDAVVYEIYPQSFADSDGDGVGDLRGVIAHLDHLQWLGVDAIWFNPCFASPFRDAGYDVADYLRIAPRYGSNDDMVELVEQARARGIRVLLDLVVGHTSDEHPWFQAELAADGPAPEGDRYVWRTEEPARGWQEETPGIPAWVPSPGPRPGWYLKNFYDSQPALNFGWLAADDEPWRDPVDAPGPRRNRDALVEIMDFWLSRGVAGFRVDMAFSLVKDYDTERARAASTQVWREVRDWLDRTHPDAVLIPEGDEPRTGEPLAYDADFALVIHPMHASLLNNGGAGTLPWYPATDCWFDADGGGSLELFLAGWDEHQRQTPGRPMLLASSDHDFSRLVSGPRTAAELGAVFTFLLTWGTVPSIYYGDEIGMRYLPGLPDVEGSICHPTYNRAGARTPMQWDRSAGAGFSTAAPDRLYLPVDPDPDRPDVATQRGDEGSLLHLVRRLLALRREVPALRVGPTTEVLHTGHPLVYRRGGSHLVALNPTREPVEVDLASVAGARLLLGQGAEVDGTTVRVDGFGHGVWELGS